MQIENWYGQTLKFGEHEFHIDQDGQVTCQKEGSLGHLETCFENGRLIANLFEATHDIDLGENPAQHSIF